MTKSFWMLLSRDWCVCEPIGMRVPTEYRLVLHTNVYTQPSSPDRTQWIFIYVRKDYWVFAEISVTNAQCIFAGKLRYTRTNLPSFIQAYAPFMAVVCNIFLYLHNECKWTTCKFVINCKGLEIDSIVKTLSSSRDGCSWSNKTMTLLYCTKTLMIEYNTQWIRWHWTIATVLDLGI